MTVIDLGELRDDPVPDPPARRPRGVGRPYRSLVVLLVALLTLAGAAPAPRHAGLTVPGGPAAEAFVLDDRVYVVEPPDPGGALGRRLAAYRVAPGRLRLRWRVPLPGGDFGGVLERDGLLLLSRRSADGAPVESMAVDPGTGRVGWRQPGFPLLAGDAVLLMSAGNEPGDVIRRVDVRTGRTLWSVAAPADATDLSIGPAGVERLVFVPATGAVEVRDASTGARLAARDLSLGDPPAGRRMMVVTDLLLVRDAGGAVTGYDLDTLDRRWTVSLPLLGYVDRCGRLICAVQEAGGMVALDSATGTTRWTDPRWQAVLAAAGGRLLVAGGAVSGPVQAVVDEVTGRVVADLGGWETVRRDDLDRRVVGVRRDTGGRLLVADLDPAYGGARIRDALTGVTGDCRAGGALLVCRRGGGDLGLWRIAW